MNIKQEPESTNAELDRELNPAVNIFTRVMTLPGAIARLVAGPPMTERERFNYNLAVARTRIDWLSPL